MITWQICAIISIFAGIIVFCLTWGGTILVLHFIEKKRIHHYTIYCPVCGKKLGKKLKKKSIGAPE